jgi:hypothetical protein
MIGLAESADRRRSSLRLPGRHCARSQLAGEVHNALLVANGVNSEVTGRFSAAAELVQIAVEETLTLPIMPSLRDDPIVKLPAVAA